MKLHWTERNIKAYVFRIVADFIDQIENKMESLPISQDEFAKRLGVSKGRVSQILNRRGNVTLKTIVQCARTLGMKALVVAYEDDDPQNRKGPINPEVFRICWERSGKPRDLWDTQNTVTTNSIPFLRRADDVKKMFSDLKMLEEKKSTISDLSDFIGCPALIPTGRFAWNKTIENIKPS